MAILSGGQLVQYRSPARDPALLAEAAPGSHWNMYYAPNTGLSLAGVHQTYAEIYRRQPAVATLIRKVATTAARTPTRVYRQSDDGQQTDAAATPLAELFRKPNRRHSPFFFWLWTVSTHELYGEAIWIKARPDRGAPPVELWPMHPTNVVTQRDEDGVLWYVLYAGSGGAGQPVIAYPEQDVVHFKTYNPDDPVRGLSPLEPLRSTLSENAAMQDAQSSFWRNGARPSVLLHAPGKLSDRALLRLKGQWDALYSGVSSWGKTAVLEEGVQATVHPLNATDLQMVEMRKLSWSESCSLYDVPPPAVHVLDHATFSNVTEQLRSMYRDVMPSRFGLYESDIYTHLIPDFDGTGRLRMEFDTRTFLRGDMEARFETYQKGIQSGVLKPAEARGWESLPDAGPEADKLYANAAMVPIGQGPAAAANPAPAGMGTNEPDPGTVTQRSVRPDPVLVSALCGACETPTQHFSKRGWCRSCEGRAGRRKELTG